MSFSKVELISQVISEYLGRDVAPVALDIFPDPRARGVYAVRVKGGVNSGNDFLLSGVDRSRTPRDLAREVEEVEFTEWPPTSK